MTKTLIPLAILAACVACAMGAETPFDQWPYLCPIELEKAPEKGILEIHLTPQIFDLARPDLADLRIATEANEEIGYVLRAAEGAFRKTPLEVRVYNQTYLPGKQSSVTVDFGRKVLKNRIEIKTPGANFRRKVLIESADDGRNWQKVREDAFLFRIVEGGDAYYDKQVVAISDNDQRYLRLTIFNGPDDPNRIEIEAVRARHLVETPAETAPVEIVSSEIQEVKKDRVTEIVLDLGVKNLPLHQLALRFTDANFFRRVAIAGRDQKERIVRTPVEDAPALERRIEQPWNSITSDAVYRYSSGGHVEESLAVDLRRARCRYLQIRIHNGDNPPLHFQQAQVTRVVYYVDFPPKAARRYNLYLGNERAEKPSYDVGHYIGRFRAEGVASATTGKVIPNPTYRGVERVVPWSERHKGILWLALLAGLVVLVALVLRQAKTAPATSTETPKEETAPGQDQQVR